VKILDCVVLHGDDSKNIINNFSIKLQSIYLVLCSGSLLIVGSIEEDIIAWRPVMMAIITAASLWLNY
jgi:hypothetical protein